MKNEIRDDLISKHLTGESTPEEDVALWDWIESEAGNEKVFNDAIDAYVGTDVSISTFEIERSLGKVMPQPVHVMSAWWSLAACIALVSVLAAVVVVTDHSVLVSTRKGERKQITLPDLSLVWLNGGSSISYDEDNYQHDRKIVLKGEAYFQITDSAIPFVIEYDSIKVSINEGEINVQAYASEEEKICVIGEGIATFRDLRKNNLTLTASTDTEVLSQSRYGLLSASINQNLNFNSWVTGRYAFEDESIESIRSLINKGNNFDLPPISPEVRKARISGIFDFEGSPARLKEFIYKLPDKAAAQPLNKL